VIERYAGYISGNAASIEETIVNRTRWTFNYADNKWTVNNVATPARQLSYNSVTPRFAAYGNAGQHELQLFKMAPASCTSAAVTTDPTAQSTTTVGTAQFTVAGTGSVQWQENTGSGWNNLANGGV